MLIVLPPSEGKTAPAGNSPLDLSSLSFPGLGRPRTRVLASLVKTCRSDPQAAGILGLGPRQAEEVAGNIRLRSAPCGPAIEVYTGVLYDALGIKTLDPIARRRVNSMVSIASALFGLLRPNDLIPAYRLSADTSLPGIGPLAHTWREPVSTALESVPGVILDLRSAAYAGLGPLPAAIAGRAVTGRVLLEREGKRSIVSHHNKATKGRIVRSLAEYGSKAKDVDALVHDLQALGFHCELQSARKLGAARTLDIVVPEL